MYNYYLTALVADQRRQQLIERAGRLPAGPRSRTATPTRVRRWPAGWRG